jgi:hypothetical protein
MCTSFKQFAHFWWLQSMARRSYSSVDMTRVPQRYAPLVYGIIQAAVTTAVATAVATHQLTGLGPQFLWNWMAAWLLAWLSMLPLVVLVSPLIARAVSALTTADGAQSLKR